MRVMYISTEEFCNEHCLWENLVNYFLLVMVFDKLCTCTYKYWIVL